MKGLRVLALLAGILSAVFLTAQPLYSKEKAKEPEKKLSALLEEVITAYGGESNLKKLDSHKAVWYVTAVARRDKGTDTRSVVQPAKKTPGKLKVELLYSKSTETRVYDGVAGLYIGGKESRHYTEGPQMEAMKEQLMRLYTPLTLKRMISELAYEETDTHVVLVLKDGNVTGKYFINPETYLIEKFSGSFTSMGMAMEFVTEYSDFKTLPEGIVWHNKETKYASGVNTAVLTLKYVEPDYKFEKDVFDTKLK